MKTRIHILASIPDASRVLAFAASTPLATPDKAENPIPQVICWMPAGRHAISAGTLDGTTFTGYVNCDEQAARAVIASFNDITKSGQRVWLDFDHDDGEASAWVKAFSWDSTQGILAHVEWTAKGEQAVRGKAYYSFSPAFEAEGKTGRVHGLIGGHAAGGLVNAPAFGAAMPALIAARISGVTTKTAPGGEPDQTNMNEVLVKLLAALGVTAPANSTDEQLLAIVAKHQSDAKSANSAEVEKLKGELAAIQAAHKSTADAIAAQAKASQEAAASQAKEIVELKAVQAANAAKIASVSVTSVDLVDVLAAYAAKDPAQLPASARFSQARADLAAERAQIWAKHIAPHVKKEGLHDLISLAESRKSDVSRIAAKSVTGPIQILASNTTGTLSGSLITQQSLSLLKAELPALSAFTTDFSNESAKLNQTIITRTRAVPTVSTYTTSYTAGNTSATDVPVTITAHRYVQFAYNANELASTNRDLFGENAEGSIYALGKDVLDTALVLVNKTNFSAGAQATIVTQTNFNRAALIAAHVALRKRKVYAKEKFLICNEDYFGNLAQDASIVSLAAYQMPGVITGYQLPNIAGFSITPYVDLPANGVSLTAFMGTKEALIMATRLPYDYVDAQAGANYGTVSQITDPGTGLSVMLTQYVNHDTGSSNYRVALLSGSAVGDTVRAQLITSA